uniref:Immunoglobulin V-set domain-containing protein n=1 Tax=Xenopus tropicalis TaxID=8364 RepID=A0A803JRJ7_XENTR
MSPFLPIYFVLLWHSYAESQPSLILSSNTVNLGERAKISCDIGAKDEHWVFFLKQIPGNAPQLIIYHHHSFTSPRYGPGISTDRYTTTINSAATEYQFVIKKAETADTAHYYCAKWFNSISGIHSDTESDKNTGYNTLEITTEYGAGLLTFQVRNL